MYHFIQKAGFGLLLGAVLASASVAAPVLVNGGFEDNPPSGFGNNIGHAIAPWVLGGGDSSNVVKVDGGARGYGPVGPEFDASAPGVGVDQHYLDIANGANDFYQEFTPLCDGRIEYGAYFSRRPSNEFGVAGITILQSSDGSAIAPRQEVTLPLGTPQTDPWTRVAFQATLVANTPYKFFVDMDNDMNMDNAFVVFLDQCDLHEDPGFDVGVADPEPEPEPVKTVVAKTCDPVMVSASNPRADTGTLACKITVTHGTEDFRNVDINEVFTGPNGPIGSTITGLTSSDAWACSSVPPASDLDSVSCTMTAADLPANAVTTIDVTLEIPIGDPTAAYENCAVATGTVGPKEPSSDAVPTLTDLVVQDLGKACAPVVFDVTKPDAPKPVQCMPFKAEVTCDKRNGGYAVSLSNSLSGQFDPTLIDVTVLTAGVTATSNANDPLRLRLLGASAGDTVQMSLAATEHGAGSKPGLDLCCMGAVEVVIPKDLVCDKAPEQSVLDVTKTCEPTAQGFGAGNTVCHMDVTYSGPAPTPSNPISITDSIAGGSGIISINAQDPTGNTPDVWACSGFGGAAVTCAMHNGIDATNTPNYWQNYSTTLDLYLDTKDEYRNCATAAVTLKDGSVVEAEDCFSKADTALEIVKSAKFEICVPGDVCQFDYTVNNLGSADYNGAITLNDTVTPVGGNFTGITPALCNVADLTTAAGCTGAVSVPAGGSVTFTVDYAPPVVSAAAPLAGEGKNCVALTDETMGQFDDPAKIDGHTSCVDFKIGEPRLTLEKVLKGECLPNQICEFDINIISTGAAYNGNIALGDTMGGTGGTIVSTSPALPADCTLPTSNLICVMPVSVPAGGTYTLSVQATYTSLMKEDDHNRNCAVAVFAPASAILGSFKADEAPDWTEQATVIGQSCVAFDAPEVVPEFELVKSCEIALDTDRGPVEGTIGTKCDITLTNVSGTAFAGDITVDDVVDVAGFGQSSIFSFVCGAGFAGPASPNACSTNDAVLSANGQQATATVVLVFPAWADMTDAQKAAVQAGQNCTTAVAADGAAVTSRVCTPVVVPEFEECGPGMVMDVYGHCDLPVQPEVTVTKTCDPSNYTVASGATIDLTCKITVTATGYPDGMNFQVMDVLTGSVDAPVFDLVQDPSGWNCTNNGSDIGCTVSSTDLNANGGSLSQDITVVVSNPLGTEGLRNCAKIYLGGGQFTQDSCVDITITAEDIPPIPERLDVALQKTFDHSPVIQGQGRFTLTPSLVSGGLQVGDVVVITDMFGPNAASVIGPGTSNNNWNCGLATGGQAIECLATVTANGVMPAGQPFLDVQTGNGWQNCATIAVRRNGIVVVDRDGDNNRACAMAIANTPAEPVVNVTKTCVAQPRLAEALTYVCTVSVTTDGTPLDGPLLITDAMALPTQADGNLAVGAFVGNTPGMACSTGPYSIGNVPSCIISPVDVTAAQNTLSMTAVVVGMPADFAAPGAQNCAVATINGAPVGGPGCHVFTAAGEVIDQDGDGYPAEVDCDDMNPVIHPGAAEVMNGIDDDCDGTIDEGLVGALKPAKPVLEVTKSLKAACTASEAAQTYTCDFVLTVTNIGGAPYVGPIALDDRFGDPKPTDISASGEGWECLRTDGKGTNCLKGDANLAQGQSTSVTMTTKMPSSPQGAQFENCVGLGVGESAFLQASVIQTVMQRLGIDGGPVDGAPGPQTRAGIRQLQERLNLPATGEIDAALFAALGLGTAADAAPACITVDLPPVKRPLVCAPPQVKNSKGVCYTPKVPTAEVTCKKGQLKNSKGQCYTPKDVAPKAASCDARSTVQRGSDCACRYSNMRKKSATSCVCSNTGLSPIPGVGCPSIKIGGGTKDDVDGHPGDGGCKLEINGICLSR